MITRRNLLATAAAASLIRPKLLQAQTTGVTPIFINWGGWYSLANPSRENWAQLSPAQFQFRAPWFCKVLGPDRLACEGTQADVDIEIQAAANAGVKAFAYVNGPKFAGDNSSIYQSYALYNTSAYKSSVKFVAYIGQEEFGNNPWSNTAAWQSHCNWWVANIFPQSNYLKIGGRPILIISWHQSALATHHANNTANVLTSINYLRSQSIAAGQGSPYIISRADPWGAPSSAEAAVYYGANAITDYVPALLNSALPNTAADLDTMTQAWWAAKMAEATTAGIKYVPNAILGWDRRPRLQMPNGTDATVPWSGHDAYWTRGTPAQVATHLQNCINFIGANPTMCDLKLMFVYAWNECSEGGTTGIPIISDPPTGTPPTTNMLNAIKPVLTAAA